MTQQNPAIVPLTVVSSQNTTFWPTVAIGTNALQPLATMAGNYWFVVVDRTTLQVVANAYSADPSAVPSSVESYAGNSQFLLILLTWGVTVNNVPQGALYEFLESAGASSELARLEQINLQLSCGVFGAMSYVLVGQMGSGSDGGFELSSLAQNEALGAVLTLQLLPTVIDGVIYYSPIEIAG